MKVELWNGEAKLLPYRGAGKWKYQGGATLLGAVYNLLFRPKWKNTSDMKLRLIECLAL